MAVNDMEYGDPMDVEMAVVDSSDRYDYTYREIKVHHRHKFGVTYKSGHRLITTKQCLEIISSHKFELCGQESPDVSSSSLSSYNQSPAFGCHTGTFVLETNNPRSASAICLNIDFTGKVSFYVPYVPCCPYVHLVVFQQGSLQDTSIRYKSLVHKNAYEYYNSPAKILADIFVGVAPQVLWYISLIPIPTVGFSTSLLFPPHLMRRLTRTPMAENITMIDAWRRDQTIDFAKKHQLALEAELHQLALLVSSENKINAVEIFKHALINVYDNHIITQTNINVAKIATLFNAKLHEMIDIPTTLTQIDKLFLSESAKSMGHYAYFITEEERHRGVVDDPHLLQSLENMLNPLHSIYDTLSTFAPQLQEKLNQAEINSTVYEWTKSTIDNTNVSFTSETDIYSMVIEDSTKLLQALSSHIMVKNLENTIIKHTACFYTEIVTPICTDASAEIQYVFSQIENNSAYKPFFVIITHHLETLIRNISNPMTASTQMPMTACVQVYRYLLSLANNSNVKDHVDGYDGIYTVRYDINAITDYRTAGLSFLKKTFDTINKFKDNTLVHIVEKIIQVYKTWTGQSKNIRDWTLHLLDTFTGIFQDNGLVVRVDANFWRLAAVTGVADVDIDRLLKFTQAYERVDTMAARQLVITEGQTILHAIRNGLAPTEHHMTFFNLKIDITSGVSDATTLGNLVKLRMHELVDETKHFIHNWTAPIETGTKLQRRYGGSMNNIKQMTYWAMSGRHGHFLQVISHLFVLSNNTIETNQTWRHDIGHVENFPQLWNLGVEHALPSRETGQQGMRQYFETMNSCEYFEVYQRVQDTPTFISQGDLRRMFAFVPLTTRAPLPREVGSRGLPPYLIEAPNWWDNAVVDAFGDVFHKHFHEAISKFDQKIFNALHYMNSFKRAQVHEIYHHVTTELSSDNTDAFMDHSQRWWRWLHYLISNPENKVAGSILVNSELKIFIEKILSCFYTHYKEEHIDNKRLDNNENRRDLFCRLMQDRIGDSVSKTIYPHIYYKWTTTEYDRNTSDTYKLSRSLFGALVRKVATFINMSVDDETKSLSHNLAEVNKLHHQRSFYHALIQELANKCTELTDKALKRSVNEKPISTKSNVPIVNLNIKVCTATTDDLENIVVKDNDVISIDNPSQRNSAFPDEYTGAYALLYAVSASEFEYGQELLTRLLSKNGKEDATNKHDGCSWGKKSDRYAILIKEALRNDFQDLSGILAPTNETQRGDLIDFLNSFLIDAILLHGTTVLDLVRQAKNQTPEEASRQSRETRQNLLLSKYSGDIARTIVNESLPSRTLTTRTNEITCYNEKRNMFSEVVMTAIQDYIPAYLQTGISRLAHVEVHVRPFVSLSLLENLYTSVDMFLSEDDDKTRRLRVSKQQLVAAMSLPNDNYDPVRKILREYLSVFANPKSSTGVIDVIELSDMMRPEFWNGVYVDTLLELRKDWSSTGDLIADDDADAGIATDTPYSSANNLVFRLQEHHTKLMDRQRQYVAESLQTEEHAVKPKLMFTSHSNALTELVDTNRPLETAVKKYQGNLGSIPTGHTRTIYVESITVVRSPQEKGDVRQSEDETSADKPFPQPSPPASPKLSLPESPSPISFVRPAKFQLPSASKLFDTDDKEGNIIFPPHIYSPTISNVPFSPFTEDLLNETFANLSMTETVSCIAQTEEGEIKEKENLSNLIMSKELQLWEDDNKIELMLDELTEDFAKYQEDKESNIRDAYDLLQHYKTDTDVVVFPSATKSALRSHTASADRSMFARTLTAQYSIPSEQNVLRKWDITLTRENIKEGNTEIGVDLTYGQSDDFGIVEEDDEKGTLTFHFEDEKEDTHQSEEDDYTRSRRLPLQSASSSEGETTDDQEITSDDEENTAREKTDSSVEIILDINQFHYLTELYAEIRLQP